MRYLRPIARVLVLAAALLSFARIAGAEDASTPLGDDELFERLFGEKPRAESPGDILVIDAMLVERPESFTEEYVLSYARELRVGESYSRAELERRIASIDERLRLSCMFFTSLASYRDLGDAGGDTVTKRVEVILTVSEGFHWGFGFEPWNLSISYGNVANAGKALEITAGLNTQAISWMDPAIRDSLFFLSANAAHSVRLRGGGLDPAYLAQTLDLGTEIGIRPNEDLRVGIGAGYLGIDSPRAYLLYPEYAAPSAAKLAGLGLSNSRNDYLQGMLDIGLLEYDFKKRGGLRGSLALGARAFFPMNGGIGPAIKLSAEGKLRYDATMRLGLAAYERIEVFPWAEASSDIPAPIRADLAESRCVRGLASGEFSSQSRLSLDYALGKPIQLGFTSLCIIPELYYEIGFVRRASYSDRMRGQQGCGAVVQFAFAQPMDIVFTLGIGFGLPGLPDWVPAEAADDALRALFVFEIR